MWYTLALISTAQITAHALTAPARTPDAAVVVPGFLEGAAEFVGVAEALRKRGIPATVAPIHRWHWIPCLGGRSVRPILARIDHACAYATTAEELDVVAPFPTYTAADLVSDFVNNPGGVLKAGGSADPDEFPYVEPRGSFGAFNGRERRRGCSIVGHSAAGWISRIYLSEERYGGHSHRGLARGVRRLVTLGSPHAASCVEINQCVGCTRQFFTKSFLGDDAAVLAPSSGEEPAPPRHRAGIVSMV